MILSRLKDYPVFLEMTLRDFRDSFEIVKKCFIVGVWMV